MRFLIINGSPRGKYSVTLHTSLYLETLYKKHEFDYLNVGISIKALEMDMKKALAAIEKADVLIFSYPVYTFIAPSQLHRFIELLKKSKIDLKGKFVTQITTSKHFYDVTAHKYIEDNCFDMGMKVIHGLSLDMEDLLKPKGQQHAVEFIEYVIDCVKNDLYEKIPDTKTKRIKKYLPSLELTEKSDKYKSVIVCDLDEDDNNLKNMIDDFINVYPYETKIVNIREFPFKGGCLGCFNCAGTGKCVYKDNFDTFLREEIQTADSIIIAFTIKDHSMGSRFKMYDDRQFCNGHRTVTEGMPFGYIINGDYEGEHNLKTIVEARAEVGHNFLAGVGYDKETIEITSRKMVYALENKYVQPRNFYGVGGMKIFRDLIWVMRGLMKADHKYYRKHGVYDFPQKHRFKMITMCLLGALVRNPKIKSKMGNKFNEGMIAPYKKVVNKQKKFS